MYMYVTTTSCRHHALRLQSCPPFYPNSVCPELDRTRTVWKGPSVERMCAFHGGLQASL